MQHLLLGKSQFVRAISGLFLAAATALPAAAADLVPPSEVAVSHWKTGYTNQFAKTVNERTKGAVNVKVFAASQIHNDKDAMAALGTGAVQMVWPVTVHLKTVDPRTYLDALHCRQSFFLLFRCP